MRKLLLLSILSICFFSAVAQVTNISEDFNSGNACNTAGHHYPTSWTNYNVEANIINGENTFSWNCAPNGGRYNTPGINCTGYYAGTTYLDTAWFISPKLNLSSYTGAVYLHFDTKASHIRIGEKLQVLYTADTILNNPDSNHFADISQALNPIFNDMDSSDWVTHQIDLTPYKSQLVYVAFRYTSSANGPAVLWSLDNINTTPFSLNVNGQNVKPVQLSIVNTSQSEITLSYSINNSANYDIVVYDVLGRQLYKGNTYLQTGAATYSIKGLSLQHDTFYFLKMGTGSDFSVIKTVFR